MDQQGIPEGKESLLSRRNLKRVRKAWELAEKGQFECVGRCKRVVPIVEGLIVMCMGSVLVGICLECFPAEPMALREVHRAYGKSVWVGLLKNMPQSSEIATPYVDLVSGEAATERMQNLQAYGLASRKKVDMGEEG